jgi:hypothetical protein
MRGIPRKVGQTLVLTGKILLEKDLRAIILGQFLDLTGIERRKQA